MVHEILNRALRGAGITGGVPPEVTERLRRLEAQVQRLGRGTGAPIAPGTVISSATIQDGAVTPAKLSASAKPGSAIGGAVDTASIAATTVYLNPHECRDAATNPLSTESVFHYWIAPRACTLKSLYARSGAVGAGDTTAVTVRKNDVDSALTLSWGNEAASQKSVSSDVVLAAGDRVSMKIVSTGGSHALDMGWTIGVQWD